MTFHTVIYFRNKEICQTQQVVNTQFRLHLNRKGANGYILWDPVINLQGAVGGFFHMHSDET